MKTLYLARHAKAEKGFGAIDDFDRPLNERGIYDANLVASAIKDRGDVPHLFITSPAIRALSTSIIFAKVLNYPWQSIIFRERVYEASSTELLAEINNINDNASSAIIFGHNPAFTSAAGLLTGESIDNVPTSAVVCIDFEVDSWKMAGPGNGKLISLYTPAKLKADQH